MLYKDPGIRPVTLSSQPLHVCAAQPTVRLSSLNQQAVVDEWKSLLSNCRNIKMEKVNTSSAAQLADTFLNCHHFIHTFKLSLYIIGELIVMLLFHGVIFPLDRRR